MIKKFFIFIFVSFLFYGILSIFHDGIRELFLSDSFQYFNKCVFLFSFFLLIVFVPFVISYIENFLFINNSYIKIKKLKHQCYFIFGLLYFSSTLNYFSFFNENIFDFNLLLFYLMTISIIFSFILLCKIFNVIFWRN